MKTLTEPGTKKGGAYKTKVYNFAVEDYHTYYVTGLNILVHNSTGPCDNKLPGGAKGGIQLAKKTFGHTFTTHGEDMTNFLIHRAKGSGMAQGQFLDNQKAAQFILDNMSKTTSGAVNVPVPKGFPARVIMPDGTFKAATHIRLVPGGSGVKTAYPLIL